MADDDYGWQGWRTWFAWRPVRLLGGGLAWLTRIERRVFTHEPIWGGNPPDIHQYRRIR